jgi:hypothetical protein
MSGRGRGKRIAAITTVAENKIIVEKEKEKDKDKEKEKEKGAKKVSKKKQFPEFLLPYLQHQSPLPEWNTYNISAGTA